MEVKADWIEPIKAARRLAGHANAAGVDEILWIIGLDEAVGVVGAQRVRFADWIAQVTAEFDGISPSVQDLVVPFKGVKVVALLFDVSRRPYVVKNAAYGSSSGGSVEREVPWREGTAVRSARREDLVRLLVPLTRLPQVEVLKASLSVRPQPGRGGLDADLATPVQRAPHHEWRMSADLYLVPADNGRLVFPRHRAGVVAGFPGSTVEVTFENPSLRQASFYTGSGFRPDSHTVMSTRTEALIEGPGLLEVESWHCVLLADVPATEEAVLSIVLTPAGSAGGVRIEQRLRKVANTNAAAEWQWIATSP